MNVYMIAFIGVGAPKLNGKIVYVRESEDHTDQD